MLVKLGRHKNGDIFMKTDRQYGNLDQCANCGQKIIEWSDGNLGLYRELIPTAGIMFSTWDSGEKKFYQTPIILKDKHSDRYMNMLIPVSGHTNPSHVSKFMIEKCKKNVASFCGLRARRVFYCEQCGCYILTSRFEYSERSEYNREGLQFGMHKRIIKSLRCSSFPEGHEYHHLDLKSVYAIIDEKPLSQSSITFDTVTGDDTFAIYDKKNRCWEFTSVVQEIPMGYYGTKITTSGEVSPAVVPTGSMYHCQISYSDSPLLKTIDIPKDEATHIHYVHFIGEDRSGRAMLPHEIDQILKHSNVSLSAELIVS